MDITSTINSSSSSSSVVIGKINNNRKKSEVLNILEKAEIQRKSYEKDIISFDATGSTIIHDEPSSSSSSSSNVIIEQPKTPKKVSFSDELPVSTSSSTTKSVEPTVVYNENQIKDYVSDGYHQLLANQFPSPIEYAMQKTENYMKFLHGEQQSIISSAAGPEKCESKYNTITNSIKSKKSSSDNIYYIDHDITNTTTNTTINNSDENSNCSVCSSSSSSSSSTNNDKNIETTNQIFETINNTTPIRQRIKNVDENYASIMEIEVKRDKKRWLLISECSALLGDERHTSEEFFKIFSKKVFLENLFKLFDIESFGVLTQDKWIEHLKGRLTEEKQIDFAEQIESVAYVLCGEDPITFDKFCQIWNAKGILDKLYRLIDIELTNLISTNQVMEFISNLTNARSRTGFDRTAIQRLEQLFLLTVGNEKEIRLDDFKKIVTSKNPFFTDRVFQIFDKDNSGSISLQEFIDAIHQFAGQSPEDKIKFLFKVYDIDGDGLIQHRELQHVMRACMEENGMRFSEDQIEDLTMAMFEDADPFNRGAITYESLKSQLEKHGGLLENLSISIDRWLVPLPVESKKIKSTFLDKLPHQFTTPYLRNNYVFLVFLTIYFVINAGLFISRCIQYKSMNGFVILARACGQCLNFNCAFVLVLMLRKCITFLRTRGYGGFLPLDNHIYMHKLTGTLIAIYSLVHTIMHLFNFSLVVMSDPIINAKNYTLSEWMFTTKPKLFGLWAGCANPTGFALAAILLIMFVCSLPFVRRTGRFEIFYYTHLLYVPFWILVIFHGPNFWKWFIGPLFVFLIERTVKFIWMRSGRGKTYISSGLLLPSKVTHLVIKRPVHFYFRPGDYVFVNIPAIAKYEWHPFTLSSAPEQEEYMWLHVRGVGEWTNRLYSYFEREQQRLHNGEIFPLIPNHQKFKTTSINIEGGNSSPQSKSSINIHKDSKNSNFETTKQLADTVFDNEKNNDINKQQKPFSYDILQQGTSKTAPTTDNFITPPANRSKLLERQISENTTIKKIQATLHRTFSRKSNMSTSSDPVATKGYLNDAYLSDGTHNENANTLTAGQHKISTDKKLNMLLFKNRAPLEKSLSMPDMENRLKKRERLMALREYTRSESERSFDEVQIKNARLQSLGLAYLSPQNKSLAQSFRYMRNKPTIIAFKTPSLENCDQRLSQNSIGSIIVSPGVYSQKLNEEERSFKITNTVGIHTGEGKVQRSVNYPVGKPLENNEPNSDIVKTVCKLRKYYNPRYSVSLLHADLSIGHGIKVYIDGPYGAPASHIFSAQHAILIATGIGVTPFASILQSIMHRYWKARHTCPRCDFEWSSEIPHTVMNLRKVDFFWINRDQRSFEWFVNLLSQLEIEQAELGGAMERFLDMHMYITSALQKTDMKAVGLQLALDLLHQKEKRDLITGLKTRTNAGRPNWDKVFKQLQDQKKGKVTVFYCGPPQLGKTLRVKCDQFGFDFRKEIF